MRASSPAVETPGLKYEAVSPELVLVDPELARRARRALSMPRPVPSSTLSRSRRLLVVPPAILGSALALTTVVLPVWAVHRSEGTVKVNPTPAPVKQPLRFS